MKTCSRCHQEKPLSEFRTFAKPGRKAYPHAFCRLCELGYNKSYRDANNAAINMQRRAHHLANRTAINAVRRDRDARMRAAWTAMKELINAGED